MEHQTIEVYFDPDGICGGKRGCYRARLEKDHRVHDAGSTALDACNACVITAQSLGRTGPFWITELGRS